MTVLYSTLQKPPFIVPGYHDPDQIRVFGIKFRPDLWMANIVYGYHFNNDPDYVSPTVQKGLAFRIKYPGKSGSVDPFTGAYREGDEVKDGTCVWEAINFAYMPPDQTLIAFNAPTCTHGVVITSYSRSDNDVAFVIPKLTAAAEAAKYFEISGKVTKNTTETIPFTLYFKVADQ